AGGDVWGDGDGGGAGAGEAELAVLAGHRGGDGDAAAADRGGGRGIGRHVVEEHREPTGVAAVRVERERVGTGRRQHHRVEHGVVRVQVEGADGGSRRRGQLDDRRVEQRAADGDAREPGRERVAGGSREGDLGALAGRAHADGAGRAERARHGGIGRHRGDGGGDRARVCTLRGEPQLGG